MKTIRISQDVWDAMVKVGKFGETPDDVLRRVFGVTENMAPKSSQTRPLKRYSQQRMSARVEEGQLKVTFENGKSQNWVLPECADKLAIRYVRDRAVDFACNNGASLGQVNAVKKALTEAGYHLSK